MKTCTIWVDDLTIPERLRQADAAKVDALAESMAAIGLQQPISIYTVDDPGGGPCDAILVAGLHRLRAAQKLGWDTMQAFDLERLTATERELWEISENLHRAELTALQRSEQIARWVELTTQGEAEAVEPGRGGKPAQLEQVSVGGRGKKGGLSAVARSLGLSRGDVQRSVKVASLSVEAKQTAQKAGLDNNRSALLEAGKQDTPGKQVAAIKDHAAQTAHTVEESAVQSNQREVPEIPLGDGGKPSTRELRKNTRAMELERNKWMGKAERLEAELRDIRGELEAAIAERDALLDRLKQEGLVK